MVANTRDRGGAVPALNRHFDAAYSEHLRLRDGTQVVLRLLRPEDKPLLRDGFTKLSPESRYARFFSPKQALSDDDLRYLCEIDQEKHFAIGAQSADGVGLGVARFIAFEDEPGIAEAAITVADEAQGHGLGKLLFLRLCAAAAERGIEKFRCEVLGSNTSMQHLLEAIAPERQVEVEQGVMSIELAVPQIPPAVPIASPPPEGSMYRLFRAAAENTVEWTDRIRNLWGHDGR